jgi:hypothetical protein
MLYRRRMFRGVRGGSSAEGRMPPSSDEPQRSALMVARPSG